MESYSGIHVALVSAFTGDGAPDLPTTRRLVDELIGRGVHGLVANASTGQFATLSVDERKAGLAAVTEAAAGRVPVTAQVGAMTTAEAVMGAAWARELGAAAVMAVTPYYDALDEREVEGYYSAVAEVGLPVMLYNNPWATGWSMSPELVARLARIDGVRFLKDSTGELDRVFRIRHLCGDGLQVISGWDTLVLPALLSGVRCLVLGSANAVPEALFALWRLAVVEEDLDAARSLWAALYPVCGFFMTAGFAAAVRAATSLRVMDVGPARPPVLPLRQDLADELVDLLARLDVAFEAAPRDVGPAAER